MEHMITDLGEEREDGPEFIPPSNAVCCLLGGEVTAPGSETSSF